MIVKHTLVMILGEAGAVQKCLPANWKPLILDLRRDERLVGGVCGWRQTSKSFQILIEMINICKAVITAVWRTGKEAAWRKRATFGKSFRSQKMPISQGFSIKRMWKQVFFTVDLSFKPPIWSCRCATLCHLCDWRLTRASLGGAITSSPVPTPAWKHKRLC